MSLPPDLLTLLPSHVARRILCSERDYRRHDLGLWRTLARYVVKHNGLKEAPAWPALGMPRRGVKGPLGSAVDPLVVCAPWRIVALDADQRELVSIYIYKGKATWDAGKRALVVTTLHGEVWHVPCFV